MCLLSVEAMAQKKSKAVKDTAALADSVEFYEVEIGVKQKNYMEQLVGDWMMDTMRRQSRAVPETFSNVSLSFGSDSTFSGITGCNKLTGAFRLKDTSIKFLTVNSTEVDCKPSEAEVLLQRLLTQTVSAYTVDNDVLLLRDGSSNVVFRAHRKKD
jgi:heat shock protein HslJ